MRIRTEIVITIVTLLVATNALALKVKVYTLKELMNEADSIVVATITIEDGEPLAKVQKVIKGKPEKTIKIRTFSLRDTDVVQFGDKEKTLLFLGPAEPDGGRKLIGYGDQGKWPKQQAKWPYTAAHTSSLERVEALVTELVQKHGNRKQIESRVVDLLHSNQSFDQIIALEYLESPDYQSLRKLLESDIEKISESEKSALKQKALFIKSLDKKNAKKVDEEEKGTP